MAFAVFPIENIFAEEEILILVENDVRKVYYTGDNIVSAFHEPEFASVIFETDYNAKLEIKAPQVYKNGSGLFVLRNGEEISPETRTDDCFYYTTIETLVPETIEIIFAFWPEYPETKKGCETFTVSPLKQHQLGIATEKTQCKESLILVTKYDGSPACVKEQTISKLIERGWAKDDSVYAHAFGSSEEDYRNLEPIYRDNPNNPGELILDLDAMIKKYDLDSGIQEINVPVYPRFDNGVTEIINPDHKSLKYRVTSPIIDDTYLSKNVQQWKDAWSFELKAEYEKYGDDFYTELGRLLMKNEMQYQMNNLGIVNAEDNFEVISGMMLTSLPPHIGFSSIIHATDGHYYWLQGMTHANKVSYYKTTQLQYPNPVEIDFTTLPSETLPRTSILMEGNNDLKSDPPHIVLNHPGDVEFYNETPETLTIYLDKDGLTEFSFETSQQILIQSNSGVTWEFTEPGSYSWHGEVPTMIDGKEYDLNTGGGILVLSDDMSNLSKEEQMETAKMILMTSGLPITGMGQHGTENTIYISLDYAINELLPESRQYYLQRAQQLIPFDISIKLD